VTKFKCGFQTVVLCASLKQVVFQSIYAKANARIQMAASQLGAPTYLTEAEAIAADAANGGQIDRAWAFWVTRAAVAVRLLQGHHGHPR
jgi:hypothetical protein